MSSTDWLPLLQQGGARPAPDAPLFGQFCLTVPGAPYGPRPGAADNIVFLAELMTIWHEDRAEAQRILDHVKAMGLNHVPFAGAVSNGYGGAYPATNWLSQPDYVADYLEWLTDNGIEFSFFAFTDQAPWYDSRTHEFDIPLVRRDFVPFFTHPRLNALIRKVVYMWEDYQDSRAQMKPMWDILYECFPVQERTWHNPPDHLNPGMSYEPETELWIYAINECHVTGFSLQSKAMDRVEDINYIVNGLTYPMHDQVRPILEQNVYDVKDMVRRLVFGYAGVPTRTPEGRPVTVDIMEGPAHGTWYGLPPRLARNFYLSMRSIEGVRHILDALPNAE